MAAQYYPRPAMTQQMLFELNHPAAAALQSDSIARMADGIDNQRPARDHEFFVNSLVRLVVLAINV